MPDKQDMLDRQLRRRGISDQRVLDAMAKVPREEFVDPELREQAYEDRPLAIGCRQTVSQPFIVASMLQSVAPQASDRVLEVGTGSGYQTALLAELAGTIVSIERYPELAETARERLQRMGYANVQVVVGDGTLGYPAAAPYDVILVSAAAPQVPPSLVDQLAMNGRMIVPVGNLEAQQLVLVRRSEAGMQASRLDGCAFVPLIGAEGFHG